MRCRKVGCKIICSENITTNYGYYRNLWNMDAQMDAKKLAIKNPAAKSIPTNNTHFGLPNTTYYPQTPRCKGCGSFEKLLLWAQGMTRSLKEMGEQKTRDALKWTVKAIESNIWYQ